MSKLISLLLSFVMCILSFLGISCKNDAKLEKVFDYVYDLGTYKALDYDNAFNVLNEKYDGWAAGGCSAAVKQISNGDVIVGRNMDLNISNKCAYIMRTDVKGFYPTVSLMYSNVSGPDFNDLKETGLDDSFRSIIPFMATDVMNNQGLYIETNMRYEEYDAKGNMIWTCPGTNPDAEDRVCTFNFPRYFADRCKNVSEVLELAKKVNLYSIKTPSFNWNFCYVLADAEGNYGVLEIVDNKIIWNDGKEQGYQIQTNFYISDEYTEGEKFKGGVGRYDTLKNNISAVDSEEDMKNLMDRVKYSQAYSKDYKNWEQNGTFDNRSEFIMLYPGYYTTASMLDENNKEDVYKLIDGTVERYHNKYPTRQDKQDFNTYWESTFTIVANTKARTIDVRFFENEAKTIKLKCK